MDDYRRLLLANRMWATEKLELDATHFDDLAKGQEPSFLWIGSSDSRVAPHEIMGTSAGEVFTHRNIANVVSTTDFNLLSVLEYAVEQLKVKHIIVCGHYGCGGVKAAMGPGRPGSFLSHWLQSVKGVYKDHKAELDLYSSDQRTWDKLVELNVLEQVRNLSRTSIVQRSWHRDQQPMLHGWVYGLRDGLIKDLVEVQPGSVSDDVYTFDFQ